jgi:putative ABC transport system permease protein
MVRDKVSIIQLLQASYKERMERIPGRGAGDASDLVRRRLPGPQEFLHAEPRGTGGFSGHASGNSLPGARAETGLAETRTGAIVGRQTADRFHWKIGDQVPIKSPIWHKSDGSDTWEFDIVGIYDAKDKGGFDTTAVLSV